jgi:hypothetical protein
MAKAGRKRKEGAKRDASGKVASSEYYETVTDARAVALAQPHRMGEVSQLAGTPHGRARMRYRQGDKLSGISPTQYEAADEFAKRRRAYLMHVTTGLPKFGSTLDAMIARGGVSSGAMDDDRIAAIRSNMAEVMDALRDGEATAALDPMTSVFLFNAPENDPPHEFWPYVRPALNAIANRLKIKMPDDPMKKGLDSRPRPRDVGINAG